MTGPAASEPASEPAPARAPEPSADSPVRRGARFAVVGRVVTPAQVLERGAVVVDGATVAWVGPADDARAAGWGDVVGEAVSRRGDTVLPGLVDLHCHGGGGAGFPEAPDARAARTAVAAHRRRGTTSLVASLVTAPAAQLVTQVRLLRALAAADEIAGIHLEGPFLAAGRSGAQDPGWMLPPDPVLTQRLIDEAGGHLVTMTLAPELPGALGPGGVVEVLLAGDVVPSFGHTDASPDQASAALRAVAAGVGRRSTGRSVRPTVTHLFNGMAAFHHRVPGPAPRFLAAAARGECVVELVADGVHLAPDLVSDVFSLVGAQGIALVTDATAAAGMPDGAYRLGGRVVAVRGGVARLAQPDGEHAPLAGGTAFLLDVVRRTVAGGVPLVDAVRAAATTPAEVLGGVTVGALEAGRRADVLVTDADLAPRALWRAGVPQSLA